MDFGTNNERFYFINDQAVADKLFIWNQLTCIQTEPHFPFYFKMFFQFNSNIYWGPGMYKAIFYLL